MSRFLISGHINIETTLQIERFPLVYEPVCYPFFGVNSTVSGVGYNVAMALQQLGGSVSLLSIIGDDLLGQLVQQQLTQAELSTQYLVTSMPQTAQSVILYDASGQRQIHTDLKHVQEQTYPPALFAEALTACDIAVLCNINYSRPLLAQARQANKLIATDVHAIYDLHDAYNADFMAAADILFMSHEKLPCPPEEWARQVQDHYQTAIIVIGLGSEGALLAVREDALMERVPAVYTRPVVNTVGAGDALFSSFLWRYAQTKDPYEALRSSMVFASYKIGESGGTKGFLTAVELQKWEQQLDQQKTNPTQKE